MSKKAETTDAGAVRAPGGVPESPMAAVRGLMDERRRYESWLAGLEARRGTTPPRVFERVHADYTTRLESVVDQLRSHTDEMRQETDRLTAQLETLHDEQQQARDERAEAELRAHVGELAQDRWEVMARAADERIAQLGTRQAEVEAELARTRELLEDAERPATPADARAAQGGEVPAAAEPQPVSDSAEGMAHVPAAGDDAATEPAAAAPVSDVEVPVEISPSLLAAQGELLDSADLPPVRPSAAKPGRASSFDELAFLNSVVDTPQKPATQAFSAARIEEQRKSEPTAAPPASPPRADQPPRRAQPWAASSAASAAAAAESPPAPPARRDTFELRGQDAGIENLDAAAASPAIGAPAGGVPLAANISGNHPIVLGDKPAEGAKTLKCADCGAMNYPTEWYCERCGAELASL